MEAAGRSNGVNYDCLLFDMDDTLYPLSSGLNLACRNNIIEYMLEHLDIEESEVPRMCLELYREYGTTMTGLKALGYEFDNDEFHAYVHGRLPYEKLKPDPVLRNLLLSMPQRKIIFTNADHAHAVQVLNKLGLEDCFEGIICFETLNPPEQVDYLDVVEDLTVTECLSSKRGILCKPSDKIFFDDSTRNIASGKAAGLHTVIVSHNLPCIKTDHPYICQVGSSVLVPGADHALSSIYNIKEALPEIWEVEEGEQLEQVIQTSAVETVVLA